MTKGIINNNPLNIRISKSNWQGKVFFNTDGEFEQFIHMDYGFRAALLTIETYIEKHGCDTIRKIISRWAPPNENNTEEYIRFVCGRTNIGGNEVIAYRDRRLKDILAAMAIYESGRGIEFYFDSLDRVMNYAPER